ncbi:hypothetical protein JXA12_00095 [Candidatus Woesearchaeota archaeon]|nr:hypothetical protein [Candidatus Woesearchaeota archaeon]
MKDITVGMELELLVLDEHYRPANEADRLLAHGLPGVIPECSKAMIEVNTIPGDIFAVRDDLYAKLRALASVAEQENLRVLPLDMAYGDFTPVLRSGPRYEAKARLLGDKFSRCGGIVGQHTHFALLPDDDDCVRQVNFLIAADPVGIATMGASPRKGVWNARLLTYRNEVYGEFAYQSGLQPLKRSFASYLHELEEEFVRFQSLAAERAVSIDGIMDSYNSIAGPVRLTRHGTVETRTAGANPDIARSIGYSALLLGGMRRIVAEGVAGEERLLYALTGTESHEEQYAYLSRLSEQALRLGTHDPEVSLYVDSFTAYCAGGLSADERLLAEAYLCPEDESPGAVLRRCVDAAGGVVDDALARTLHRVMDAHYFRPSLRAHPVMCEVVR